MTGDYVDVDGIVIANQVQFSGNYKSVRTGRGSTTQGSPTVGFDAW